VLVRVPGGQRGARPKFHWLVEDRSGEILELVDATRRRGDI